MKAWPWLLRSTDFEKGRAGRPVLFSRGIPRPACGIFPSHKE
jgi:hypothetical protein